MKASTLGFTILLVFQVCAFALARCLQGTRYSRAEFASYELAILRRLTS